MSQLLVVLLLSTPLQLLAGVPHKGQHERETDGAFSPRDVHHNHKDGAEHNSKFDHESILGSSKDAEEFDQLPPKEAKKRLAVLLTKMDRNKDSKIGKDELHSWIVRSFRSLSQEESGERFDDADTDKDGAVSWEEYRNEEYDLDLDGEAGDAEEKMRLDPDRTEEYNVLQEDKILFDAADKDHDGRLDRKEFLSFSHPEEDKAMHEIVLWQVLKQKDTNGDGKIDFQEYVGDRGRDQNKEWLVDEKDRFDSELDKGSKDGSLDRAEILEWMIPSNDEIAKDEVSHLFAGADDDADGELTFEEVLDHHDLFVGSEATDYGEHLQNLHKFDDEL